MVKVEINEDIRKKEVKAVGPLTMRQVITVGVSMTYAVPIAVHIPADFFWKFMAGILLAMPVAACGWIQIDGQHLEILAVRFVYSYLLTPPKRKVTKMAYSPYRNDLKREKEKERLKKLTPAKRKKYLKLKKKGRNVLYSKKADSRMYR